MLKQTNDGNSACFQLFPFFTTVVQTTTPVETTEAPLDCDVLMGLVLTAATVVEEPTYSASSSDQGSSPEDGHLDTDEAATGKAWHPEADSAGQYLEVSSRARKLNGLAVQTNDFILILTTVDQL